jgi:CRP-like cAMP-binding protein
MQHMSDVTIYDELVPLLRQVGLFSRCSNGELKVIAYRAELRDVDAGERVIAHGEETSEMFLLLRGGAEAVVEGDVRATFIPGDHFGELAALVPAPRTSDVVATAPSTLAVLDRDKVYLLLDSVPGVARKMIEGLAISLRQNIVPK